MAPKSNEDSCLTRQHGEKPDICLVMIVRDEAHVIERCLRSVKPLATRWVIVDTGSEDDTPERIERLLGELPGRLYHRPWVNFGHNRSEAMALASSQGDFLLLIDADEELIIDPEFTLPERTGVDAWQIVQQSAGTSNEFYLPRLLRSDHPWHFEGVLHEHLASTREYRQAPLHGLRQLGHFDSARNRQSTRQKYLRDAEVLEAALESDPQDARNWFYLAQSLRDAGEHDRALAAYRHRADMGGWDEEVYCALFEIARLLERTGAEHSRVIEAYLEAWNFRPTRAEPLCELARLHRQSGKHAVAHLFARYAVGIPRPDDRLFVDVDVYRWRARDELSVASYWTGNLATAIELAESLSSGNVPDNERERIEHNLELFRKAQSEQQGSANGDGNWSRS